MALVALELTARPYDNGRPIGQLGAYEELRGKARFALDPKDAANATITDIDLATKAEDGRVHFASDVLILRPADASKRSRGLLLDVVNRGRPTTIRSFDMLDRSRDWLLSQGYTVVMCGWQHDVGPGGDALCIDAPEARQDGKPISGLVLSVPVPGAPSQVLALADGDSAAYEAADLNDPAATLTDCDYPMAPGHLIPRDQWQFGRLEDGVVVPDASHIYYAEGFQPGHTYEVIYTTSGCQLTGIGFAATRDFVSFLRYGSAEAGNPCAGDIDYTLSFGSSQSGRFLKTMLYLGLNQDEQQRPVLDGIHAHIAGGRRIESNWRFGQPGYNGPYSMSGLFPFTDLDQEDEGRVDGVQHRAALAGTLPKVVYTNSSCEYWGNYAALVHTTLDGLDDAAVPDNVRIFHLAGTNHGGGSLPVFDSRPGPRLTAYPPSSIDYRPLLRAALVNLDAWVARGVEPPASRYPHLADGTLMPRESLRPRFAALPGPGVPAHLVPFARLDFGPDATQTYQATQLPPRVGEPYPELVAALDDNFNELGGLRVPDIEVPLATYTGWNPRHPDIGGEDQPMRLNGSTMPFARTPAQREPNDPRPSIQERYASRDAFQSQVRAAAQAMVDQRLLIPDDVEPIVASSGQRWDELTAPR